MLRSLRKSDAELECVARVEAWTRARFGLGEDEAVLVAQVECSLPGCPPLETVVGFWPADGRHRHFKVFKPVEDVVEDDVPPSWLRDALVASDDADCC